MAARRKTRRTKPVVVEPWPDDEMSTRNCCHCLTSSGPFVHCRRNHPMVGDYDRHREQLTYNGVIRLPYLLKPCRGCPDLDNGWA